MRWLLALALLVIALPARADETFPYLITNAPPIQTPYTASDWIPVVRGGVTYHAAANTNLGGNVTGPAVSTSSEFALWQGTTGRIIKDAWSINISHIGTIATQDNQANPIGVDGSPLTGVSQPGLTANQIYEWSIGPGSIPAPSYDGVRGIAQNVLGSSVLDVNGVAGYVYNTNTISGGAQVSSALKGIAVCGADNSSCWGLDTITTDNTGQVLSAGTGRFLFNEFDYNVTSPNTTVGGIIGGTWEVQPVSATGWTVFKPVGVGIFQYAWGTADGCCTGFAHVGAAAASGSNINSQNINFNWFDGPGTARVTSVAVGPGGILVDSSGSTLSSSSITLAGGGGGSVFNADTNGGLQVNGHGVAGADAALNAYLGFGSTFTNVHFGNGVAQLTMNGAVALLGVLGCATALITDGAGVISCHP